MWIQIVWGLQNDEIQTVSSSNCSERQRPAGARLVALALSEFRLGRSRYNCNSINSISVTALMLLGSRLDDIEFNESKLPGTPRRRLRVTWFADQRNLPFSCLLKCISVYAE